MKIVAWNLRCLWKDVDGVNAFIHRAGFIYDKIMEEKPSVIAFQEVVPQALELLKRMLPEYEFFGSFRTADYGQEGLFVAFLKDEFTLLGADSFWMSPTPYVAGSKFAEQSDCSRVCIYTRLLYKKTLEVFNLFDVHLDHISDLAKQLGLEVLFDYIDRRGDAVNKGKTVILGDFNARRDSKTMEFATSKEWLVDSTKDVGGTFHDFGREAPRQIDYILVSKELENRIENVSLWKDEHFGIYLSDHYPVVLALKE
jgi:endonuclease/exonuclease/phosphatase family metal-dependent hydrolase